MDTLWIVLGAAALIVLASIRQVNQYERGVKFTLGRYQGIMEPGWRLVWPVIQFYKKVDMRIKAVDVPHQKAITRDNVSVEVNAVIYYQVSSAEKSILEIEDFMYAISQYAQTTMRNIVGGVTLDELLANRDKIADHIKEVVDKETDAWGLKVHNVELKDISLPEAMERTIAKQAEAEREKRAVIITSEGELAAAQNMADAARTLSATPGAPLAHPAVHQRHIERPIEHHRLYRSDGDTQGARRVQEGTIKKLPGCTGSFRFAYLTSASTLFMTYT